MVHHPTHNEPRRLSFTIEGCTSTDAARRLAEKGLFLSHGDFYAYTIVQRLGLEPEGLIRAGCACYTTEEEIDRLIDGVREICNNLIRTQSAFIRVNKVGKQPVSSALQIRPVRNDRQSGDRVELKMNRERGAPHATQRIVQSNLFRPDE